MQTKNNNKTLMCKQDQFLAWVSTGRPVAHFQPGQCWPVGGGGGVGEVVSLAMRRRIAARREGWGGVVREGSRWRPSRRGCYLTEVFIIKCQRILQQISLRSKYISVCVCMCVCVSRAFRCERVVFSCVGVKLQ